MTPGHSGDLLDEAESLLKARDLETAWIAYQRAEAAGAEADDCSSRRWMIAMLRGDFEVAWRESDAIRIRGREDPHRFWMGEDFTGRRVILRCLHGCGDAVQMMRYAPLIAERAESLVVEVAPAMADLMRMFDGVDQVITWGACATGTPLLWDVQMEVNELPYIFRTQLADLPLKTHYLKLPKWYGPLVSTEASDPDSLRVGIVWASGEWSPSRSVPARLLQPLFSTPGVEFWNLQGGASRGQWEVVPKGSYLHAAEECANSTVQLAGLIAQLDLVITPDTLAAHLAGALEKPAWVMLEHAADWRWQHGRTDSPWYPSLRLFRQSETQNWKSVIEAVRSELERLVTSRIRNRRVA